MDLACFVVSNGWELLKIVLLHRNLAATTKYLNVICGLEQAKVFQAKSGKLFNNPGKAEQEFGLCYVCFLYILV